MIRMFFLCALVLLAHPTTAQTYYIDFKIQLNGKDLELNKSYELNGTPISLTKVKFYVSQVTLDYEVQKDYQLVDLEDPSSLRISIKNAEAPYTDCDIHIGIDSTKSVSGVFGGDLDPTMGMYWTWQSGYINCKIEGVSPLCPSRKNKFQFHLGGYASPYNALRTCSFISDSDRNNYTITVNLNKFIESIDLSKDYQVMSPGKKAMRLSDLFAQCFANYD